MRPLSWLRDQIHREFPPRSVRPRLDVPERLRVICRRDRFAGPGRAALAVALVVGITTPPAQARQLLFVGNDVAVGTYNPVTGAAVNANLITLPPNLSLSTFGLARDASSNHLFVSRGTYAYGVGEYDGTTGAIINDNFIAGNVSQRGLIVDGSNRLFLASISGTGVVQYDTMTGAPNPNFSPAPGAFNVVLDRHSHLIVANFQSNVLSEYDATTGALINPTFATIPGTFNSAHGMVIDALNHLLVAEDLNNRVLEFDATTGALINANFITGLNVPVDLALDGNNHLFVANQLSGTGAVREFDATSGAIINPNFIPGLTYARSLLFVSAVPEPSSLLLVATATGIGLGIRRRRWLAWLAGARPH
jgi:hypothetical protein